MSFVTGLSNEDLRRLREIVKRVHLKHYPKHMINDYEADRLIDAIGPETAGKIIRESMNLNQGLIEPGKLILPDG
jgi:hypothetical protein